MTSQEFMALLADLYRSEPDDCVVSVGHWRDDPAYGPPLQNFYADIRLTAGEIRKMADRKADATSPPR